MSNSIFRLKRRPFIVPARSFGNRLAPAFAPVLMGSKGKKYYVLELVASTTGCYLSKFGGITKRDEIKYAKRFDSLKDIEIWLLDNYDIKVVM